VYLPPLIQHAPATSMIQGSHKTLTDNKSKKRLILVSLQLVVKAEKPCPLNRPASNLDFSPVARDDSFGLDTEMLRRVQELLVLFSLFLFSHPPFTLLPYSL
jgi:hypothetical protein